MSAYNVTAAVATGVALASTSAATTPSRTAAASGSGAPLVSCMAGIVTMPQSANPVWCQDSAFALGLGGMYFVTWICIVVFELHLCPRLKHLSFHLHLHLHFHLHPNTH
jgi:hypothetical protein